MADAKFVAADYSSALAGYMPTGLAWSKETTSIQSKTRDGLSKVYERTDQRANQLLEDGFPTTTVELLPEWEDSLGLPDPCAGDTPTLQQRRAQVAARFVATGGQTLDYFTEFAGNLGFTVTPTEYAPFRAGFNRAGDPAYGEAWAHTFALTAPLVTITPFRAGQSAAGEPLNVWGNAVLECELNRVKPAHTYLQFHYQ